MGKKEKHRTGKWKYGSVSALMLAMVLVALIALNAGVYALEKKKGWRLDFSFNGILSQSAETKAVLEKLESPVEIYALFRKSTESEFSGAVEIRELLDKYAASSELVTWKQVDPVLEPVLMQRFTTENAAPAENNLVVFCKKTGRFRIVSGEDLMSQGYNEETGYYEYNQLNYEHGITSAIAYVVRERIPQAVVVQGHGGFGEDDLRYFRELLEYNQYEVVFQDLKDSEYTPDPADLLIFFCPEKDLNDRELEKLMEFAGKGGSFLFVCEYISNDPMRTMSNYQTLLRSYGFVPRKGLVVADVNAPDTYYESVTDLVPEICSTDITLNMLAGGSRDLVLPKATAFEEPEEADRYLSVDTVLRSGDTAVLKDSGQDEEPAGPFPLALQARRITADGYLSRAFIIGDSGVLTSEYLYAQTDSMEFTVRVADYLLDTGESSLQIMPKEISRPGLKTESSGLGSLLLVALPLSVLFAALLVLGPRKNA